jgi:hypothetical protein
MWQKIIEIAKTASAMLHTGTVPPNTPTQYRKSMSEVNFLASKKFYVVFCSVIILILFYAASICVLFLTATSPALTMPFVTIFTETVKILAIIIASYLGVQTVLDYRMQSTSNIETSNTTTKSEVDEQIISMYAEKYKNDKTYAPLDWINETIKDNDENEHLA